VIILSSIFHRNSQKDFIPHALCHYTHLRWIVRILFKFPGRFSRNDEERENFHPLTFKPFMSFMVKPIFRSTKTQNPKPKTAVPMPKTAVPMPKTVVPSVLHSLQVLHGKI